MGLSTGARPCIAVYGGSFDPIHCAHVALVRLLVQVLAPDEVIALPAGNPWQKQGTQGLVASGEQRAEMARLAFDEAGLQVTVDERELHRAAPTYTIDTLRELRAAHGPDAAIVFAMGADQLRRLHTWREWQALAEVAHLFVVSRPASPLDDVDPAVADMLSRRRAPAPALRAAPHGAVCIAEDLHMEISATAIRDALASGNRPDGLVPAAVLDYIQRHHLYQKN